MKVVQVLPALEGGGVERGTLEIARALVAAGHDSIVISAGGAMVAALEGEGSRHVTMPIGEKRPATFALVAQLRRWLADERPDVMHVRSRMPGWICWYAWKEMDRHHRPRYVATLHGLHSVSIYSRIVTKAEHVIVVSDTAREYLETNFPGKDQRLVHRIHRGVDRAQYPFGFEPSREWLQDWHTEYPSLEHKRLITLPGRITRLKGHLDFADVMRSVQEQRTDVVGLVVGGVDPSHTSYRDEISARNPDLVFTGARRDLREILAISAASVSFSIRPESFGRTVVESLSLGTPVVGYDHGGVGEILATVFPRGRIPLGDRTAAVERLIALLDGEVDEPIAAEHPFELDAMCRQTLDLYESIRA